jgi:hypothetical protein
VVLRGLDDFVAMLFFLLPQLRKCFQNESGVASIIEESPAPCRRTRTKVEDIAGHPTRVLSILCRACLCRPMWEVPVSDQS